MTGWKAQLVTTNWKSYAHILPSFDDYLNARNLRDPVIPSIGIDDKESCNLIEQ